MGPRPISLLAAVVALAYTLSSCGGRDRDRAGPSPGATRSPSVTTSPSPRPSAGPTSPGGSPTGSPTGSPSASPTTSDTPTPAPELRVPPDAPTEVSDAGLVARVERGNLRPLVPPDAEIAASERLATPRDQIDQVAVAWLRGEPFRAEHGFVVWQRSIGVWRAEFAFTDPPTKGVLGISIRSGDLTGDGLADHLTFEALGGSGNCGTWRVIATAREGASQVFRRSRCDAEIAISNGRLEVREAVFEAGDPHCCPSAYRFTTLAWSGERFEVTDRRTERSG